MAGYDDALEYLTTVGRFGMKLGTERTRLLLDRLGAPDRQLRGALVGGTNGKGSTGAMLASILAACGHRVGFMPKPHLISYTERVQVDGTPISEKAFAAELEATRPAVEAVAGAGEHPTEFEILTGLALHHFRGRVDRVVCEVGLGGRLDATNALDLDVSVITNVGLDHQQYLGDTIAEIAREKAGIVKHGQIAITAAEGEALAVIESAAVGAGATLWRVGRELELESEPLGWAGHSLAVAGPGFEHTGLRVPLLGDYQPTNAALAVAAAQALGELDGSAIAKGLAETVWPGRLQVVAGAPRLILDAAHNPAGLRAAGATLARLLGHERLVVVFAMLSERDPEQLFAELRRLEPSAVVFTEPAAATRVQAVSADGLAAAFGGSAEAVVPALAAAERASELAGADGNVLVCGTHALVGEVLSAVSDRQAASAAR